MKNVMLVVDTQNINFCINKTFTKQKCKLDYHKYKEAVTGKDVLYKANAYGIYNWKEAYHFISFLKNAGFNTNFYQPVMKDDKPKFIGCAVQLTIDVVQMINKGKIDKVIFGCTGYEYMDLIRYVKSQSIEVEIYACSIPSILKQMVDKYTEIDESLLYLEKGVVAE